MPLPIGQMFLSLQRFSLAWQSASLFNNIDSRPQVLLLDRDAPGTGAETMPYRFHTFMNHSEKVASFGVQLDYLGILLLMWGATILMIYYGLRCDQRLQIIYWIVVWLQTSFPTI